MLSPMLRSARERGQAGIMRAFVGPRDGRQRRRGHRLSEDQGSFVAAGNLSDLRRRFRCATMSITCVLRCLQGRDDLPRAGFRVTAALLLSAGSALAAGCSSPEQETSYKTLSAARTAGALQNGWIPAWLPADAYNLKEKHELDASRSIVRFNFPAAEKWAPPHDCSQVPPAQVSGARMAAAWWPSDVPAPAAGTPHHSYFACGGKGEFLAVDYPVGEGFYWRVGR